MDDPTTSFADLSKVEATRYALIRRLGYVFRHHLVGSMQPINVMCQVINLKLKVSPLDALSVSESVNQASGSVRSSINSCLEVASWFAPDMHATIDVSVGVAECVSYLRSSFSFHGFALENEESNLEIPVRKIALREVLTAVLIAGADHAQGRSDIVVSVQAISDTVEITMQIRAGKSGSKTDPEAYRVLVWDEVEGLAASHEVGFRRLAEDLVKIRMSPSLETMGMPAT